MRESNEKKKKSYLSLNLNLLCIRIMCPIHYFHIDHNAPRFIPPPPSPPEFCITIVSNSVVPKEIQDNDYAKFWEVNKVHYDLCENGESGVLTNISVHSKYQSLCGLCVFVGQVLVDILAE